MHERSDGLYVKGKLDIEDSEVAREAWRSVRRNRIGLTFGFLVVDEHDDEGVKVLDTLDVFEVTLTPSAGERGREDPVNEERRAGPRPRRSSCALGRRAPNATSVEPAGTSWSRSPPATAEPWSAAQGLSSGGSAMTERPCKSRPVHGQDVRAADGARALTRQRADCCEGLRTGLVSDAG